MGREQNIRIIDQFTRIIPCKDVHSVNCAYDDHKLNHQCFHSSILICPGQPTTNCAVIDTSKNNFPLKSHTQIIFWETSVIACLYYILLPVVVSSRCLYGAPSCIL